MVQGASYYRHTDLKQSSLHSLPFFPTDFRLICARARSLKHVKRGACLWETKGLLLNRSNENHVGYDAEMCLRGSAKDNVLLAAIFSGEVNSPGGAAVIGWARLHG